MKTVIALGDLHCGHIAGLMPRGWIKNQSEFESLHKLESEMLRAYATWTRKFARPDLLIVNGDLIEGKGRKSGGTELVTSDREEQAGMAVKLLKMWNPKKCIITYGTSYHSGEEEDWERWVAKDMDCEIHNHAQFEIAGIVFDVKHHLSNSTMPHTKGTPLAREILHNLLWTEAEGCERADIVLRSHVHNYFHCDSVNWDAFSLPGLQAPSHNKHGGRRCSQVVNFGILGIQINERNGSWGYDKSNIISLESAKLKLIKF